jgi:hypothetical protein
LWQAVALVQLFQQRHRAGGQVFATQMIERNIEAIANKPKLFGIVGFEKYS